MIADSNEKIRQSCNVDQTDLPKLFVKDWKSGLLDISNFFVHFYRSHSIPKTFHGSVSNFEAEINLIRYPEEGLEESLLLREFCGNGIYLNQIGLTNLSLIESTRKNNLTILEITYPNKLVFPVWK